MHDALKSANSEIVEVYLEGLKKLNLDKFTLEELFTAKNNAGFTPLHAALISADSEIVRLFLRQLKTTCDDKLLVSQIRHRNKGGFNTLHQVAKAGCLDCFLYFIHFIFDVAKGQANNIIFRLLEQETKHGHTPSCPAEFANAKEINNCLSLLRQKKSHFDLLTYLVKEHFILIKKLRKERGLSNFRSTRVNIKFEKEQVEKHFPIISLLVNNRNLENIKSTLSEKQVLITINISHKYADYVRLLKKIKEEVRSYFGVWGTIYSLFKMNLPLVTSEDYSSDYKFRC